MPSEISKPTPTPGQAAAAGLKAFAQAAGRGAYALQAIGALKATDADYVRFVGNVASELRAKLAELEGICAEAVQP